MSESAEPGFMALANVVASRASASTAERGRMADFWRRVGHALKSWLGKD